MIVSRYIYCIFNFFLDVQQVVIRGKFMGVEL